LITIPVGNPIFSWSSLLYIVCIVHCIVFAVVFMPTTTWRSRSQYHWRRFRRSWRSVCWCFVYIL